MLVGYLAGIGILMVFSQLGKLTGLHVTGESAWQEVGSVIAQAGAIHLPTLALGLGVAIALFALRRWAPSLPGPLLVMLAAAAGVALAGPAAQGIAVIGPVPTTVPLPALPNPDGVDLLQLLTVALGIAVVGYSDVILTGRAFAARKREQLNANSELLAMGAANLANGFLAGFPVSSSASRTVIGDSAGSRTQLHSLVAAAMVLGSIFIFGPVLAAFPQAALGGVVVYAGLRLIDLAELRRIAAFRRSEIVLALVALVGVLATGLLAGIGIAVGLSILDLIRRIVHPHDGILGYVPGLAGMHDVDDYPQATQVPGLVVYRYDSPLFFANADDFLGRAMASVARTEPKPRVVRAQRRGQRRGRPDGRRHPRTAALLTRRGRDRVRHGEGEDGPARPAGRCRLRREGGRRPHLRDPAHRRRSVRDVAQGDLRHPAGRHPGSDDGAGSGERALSRQGSGRTIASSRTPGRGAQSRSGAGTKPRRW